MKKIKALTLLELIIYLAIISTLIAIVGYSVKIYDNYLLQKELTDIVFYYNQARKQSIITAIETKISYNKTNHEITIENQNYNNTLKLSDNIKMIDCPEIIFSISGAPLKANTISFFGKNKKFDLTVQVATGKVTIYEKKD